MLLLSKRVEASNKSASQELIIRFLIEIEQHFGQLLMMMTDALVNVVSLVMTSERQRQTRANSEHG